MARKMTKSRLAYMADWRKKNRDKVKAYVNKNNRKRRGAPGTAERLAYNAAAGIRNRKAYGEKGTERRAAKAAVAHKALTRRYGLPGSQKRIQYNAARRVENAARRAKIPPEQLAAERAYKKSLFEAKHGKPGSPEREIYNAERRIQSKAKLAAEIKANKNHRAKLVEFLAGPTAKPIAPRVRMRPAPTDPYSGRLVIGHG